MSLATVVSYPPVAGKKNLERLSVLFPGPDVSPELWSEVHDEVQEQLSAIEAEVRRQMEAVHVEAGRTKGERFFLFTYRKFSVPGNGLDPVVVGLTFTPAHDEVTVEADVSGEQIGDLIVSLPSKTVAKSKKELVAAARDLAQALCQKADIIVASFGNPSRKVE